MYKTTRPLQQSHVCQWEAQPYLVGPLSRLVGKPPFEPSLIKNVLPLTTAAYGPNSAILLTQTFNRTLFFACSGRDLGFKKKKTGIGRRSRRVLIFLEAINRVYRNFNGPLFPIRIEYLIYMFFLLRFVKWLLRAYKYRQLRPWLTRNGPQTCRHLYNRTLKKQVDRLIDRRKV